MYFFNSIIFISLVIISSLYVYQYLSDKRNPNISKKEIMVILLNMIELLLILFNQHLIFIVFLDFSCILAYLLKLRKEAIILSIINIIYLSFILNIPWYYNLIYVFYLGIDYFLDYHKKDLISYFVSVKAFISSFIYFTYFSKDLIYLLLFIFIFSYFYLLLKFVYQTIKNYEISKNDDLIIFQIAHEVKNPIAVCKGYLDMLNVNNYEKVNKYLPIIQSEMNRALTIMDDFLNLKRLTIHKEIMDFNMLLEDIEKTTFAVLNNKNIDLKVNWSDEEEIFLEGDYDRLKQVLLNLIKNAKEANAKNIRLDIKTNKNNILLKVIDDGDGISSNDLKKIGQIFYTTKKSGTGIGVSMSKEIIKLHHGTMKYSSLIGKGTTVTLTLPSCFEF